MENKNNKPEIILLYLGENDDILNYGPESCSSSDWSGSCCYSGQQFGISERAWEIFLMHAINSAIFLMGVI